MDFIGCFPWDLIYKVLNFAFDICLDLQQKSNQRNTIAYKYFLVYKNSNQINTICNLFGSFLGDATLVPT